MSLTLRLGDQDITDQASNIQTKNIAEGGFASVTFNVKRKLEQSLFDTFTTVYAYDPETGEQTGGGRLLEQGRNDDGTWQVTALGEGLASMQDITTPVFYIDGTLDQWRLFSRTTKRLEVSNTVWPGATDDEESVMCEANVEDKPIVTGAGLIAVNRIAELCDQTVGGIGYRHKAGTVASGNWRLKLLTYAAGTTSVNTENDLAWSATLSSRIQVVRGGALTSDRPILGFWFRRENSDQNATDETYCAVRAPVIRAAIYGADGNLRDSGYTNEYILPHEVLTDWVVRHCPRLDVEAGEISAVSTEQIEQMSYLDGVHGMQLAEDVRAREPALTWQVWEQGDNGRWPFYYLPLPTTIQYEASVDDGFSAPSPSSEIYDEVVVTGKTINGRDVNVLRTQVVPSLAAAGIHRRATIPLGSEVWSDTAANKVGDEFLAEHRTPPNAGTITIARRIFDNHSGRWIKPCNVRAGGLMRVRGIQPTPDTLNATSPDGVTVFRVVSAQFDNDSNSTVCELDSYQLTESRAIAKLARSRTRRGAA